ncbi:hypothetical protein F01_320052 [Burkholderia cenocepacia]|nr:hypothetical protein F01_320052 [Burkholderia cenocepacia]
MIGSIVVRWPVVAVYLIVLPPIATCRCTTAAPSVESVTASFGPVPYTSVSTYGWSAAVAVVASAVADVLPLDVAAAVAAAALGLGPSSPPHPVTSSAAAAAAASGTLKVVPNSAKPSFKDFRVVIIASRTER